MLGGSGLIPVRRPYDRVSCPGLVALGNAACAVFPTHASGTAAALESGKLLAQALRDSDDPGDPDTLHAYTVSFQRRLGAVRLCEPVDQRS